MSKLITTIINNITYQLIITGSTDKKYCKYCTINTDCRLGKLSFIEKNSKACNEHKGYWIRLME
jgi:hypothetical protein